MIIALAGRRIDAPNASPARFPLENIAAVREKIRTAFREAGVRGVVCAAACGADLLALDVAGELGLRRRIVLPYDRETFKQRSVTDRPGDWEYLYDRILADVEGRRDLIVYDYEPGDNDVYFAVNHDILDAAEDLALEMQQKLGGFIIWDQQTREDDDVTAHFLEEAQQIGRAHV